MENSDRCQSEDSKSIRQRTPSPSTSGTQGLSRNPWVNFLVNYRKQHKHLSMTYLIKSAAIAWRSMSQDEKAPFFTEAKKQPPRPKRRRRRRSRKTRGKKPELRRQSPSNSSSSISLDKPIQNRYLCCDSLSEQDSYSEDD